MEISNIQLNKFKEICRNRMGVDLDDATARDQALKLLTLISITRKPPPLHKEDDP